MASLITCTPGGATDNAYLTLLDADLYFTYTTRQDAWLSGSDALRERALIEATAQIERLGGPRNTNTARRPRFCGVPYDFEQALHFPRSGDFDADGDRIIPEGIQRAVCEQAFMLVAAQVGPDGTGSAGDATNPQLVDFAALQAAGVTSFSMDGLSVGLNGAANTVPEGIAPAAWAAVREFIHTGYALGGGHRPHAAPGHRRH